jgi:hypothetical protein
MLPFQEKVYLRRLTLRFGDTSTQVSLVVFPGRRAELVQALAVGVNGEPLDRLIERTRSQKLSAREISKMAKAEVSRTVMSYGVAKQALDELEAIRVRVAIGQRVSLDDHHNFQLWYDTWQEAVHFSLTGPYTSEPQDELVQWMLRFRTEVLPRLISSGTTQPAAGNAVP